MNLKDYLVSLFGEKRAKEVLNAVKKGQTVVISGAQSSEKPHCVRYYGNMDIMRLRIFRYIL